MRNAVCRNPFMHTVAAKLRTVWNPIMATEVWRLLVRREPINRGIDDAQQFRGQRCVCPLIRSTIFLTETFVVLQKVQQLGSN
jgi:hypothetical protein